jgi:DNA-binding transcriptional LysR family regulator
MLNEIDLSRADLNLLKLFEVVLQEGHVGRAGDRLRLSPSAVSHGLRRLRNLLNDPLFLKTPKGVVPTPRALQIAEPIASIMAQVRRVVVAAEPFRPETSNRRFTISAADALSAVFLPPLLSGLSTQAPDVDVTTLQMLPYRKGGPIERTWRPVLSEIDAGLVDIAVAPLDNVPARFMRRTIFKTRFVVVMRAGHPFAEQPTLERYCTMRHLLVSATGDRKGVVDEALAARGLIRRVALTVPSYVMALPVVAGSDLLAVLPAMLVAQHGPRFGLVSADLPITTGHAPISVIAHKAVMADAGLTWMFEQVCEAVQTHGVDKS